MIKEFIKKFFVMIFYALGASYLSTLIIVFLFYTGNNDFFYVILLSLQIAIIGIIIGLPVVLLSALWFWYIRNKTNFLYWASIPVLLSFIEVAIGTLIVEGLQDQKRDMIQLTFLFSFSSLQMAFYMWLKYKRKISLEGSVG